MLLMSLVIILKSAGCGLSAVNEALRPEVMEALDGLGVIIIDFLADDLGLQFEHDQIAPDCCKLLRTSLLRSAQDA
jgi:hypothetical protein